MSPSPRRPTRLAIIADLHMSAGPWDDFREDRALAEFLAGGSSALLVLGDLLDLSKVPVGGERALDSSSEVARRKLEVAATAHRDVFLALGRLARPSDRSAGRRLRRLPGRRP